MSDVSIYERGDDIFVVPISRTEDGMSIADSTVYVAARTDTSIDLGKTVVNALSSCRVGLRHPSKQELPRLADPLLRAAKVLTWSAFAKEASLVTVAEREGRWIVTARQRTGSGQRISFTGGTVAWEGAIDISQDQFGRRIRQALDIARKVDDPD
jgi:hypothetical protein